ncbi:chromosome segregation protein SMC [Belliella kenyensis]|uniref:Chromosome partition protein Smc n=1 Tax=Belliella kenyensis TaxID=1472724 RepID=A0ABV8EM24_9BACT|nr:chromosome segregation protein SMC [Belliella kenyensis]MCH7400356.1 chromosome segregation protein SMC [Belliella kenyensis]MDN3604626.1 chromosome segregation protein SMC [Belliella kenyensis]
MLLSKLEIKGFKSFGDRMVIHFDKGITGVVGPNGCGKSNVVDAIRWVLGEQKSRMLRSDKMENVIFNGTKNRKPTNLAEVSLTFENTKNLLPTEYTHVTITRRYYRSGESEYLLNGVTCRLKDITNLFMDTGINSNSYAIIELKMIEELLNDKNNSRRDLFEEAAGISKFKARKKETLRKLEDTDGDLDRVEDVLFEIDKNLKSLEKQAKQTAKYFEIKQEYKIASINLAKKSVASHSDSLIKLHEQIEQESDKKIMLSTKISEKESMLEQVKSELIHKEKLLSSRQKTLNEHVNKIRQFESDKKIKNERLRFLEDRAQKLREQIDVDRKSNDRAGFSIRSLEQELESARKILAEKEFTIEQLKVDYDQQKTSYTEIQEKQKEFNKEFALKKDLVYQLSKDKEIKQIQYSTLKQELEKTASDDYSQEANLADFEDKLVILKEELDKSQEELIKLKSREEDHNRKIEELNKLIEMIREEVTQSSRKLDAKQNEFNLTKSLVENLEGFPEAIKFLKKNTSWSKDTPLLSDILTTEEKYRVTIENFLEGYMNYYVVDTQEQAIAAVNLLSDAARGKANFFVLADFDKFQSSQSKLFPNAIPATEIIEYDEKYAKLISFILDDVYLVRGEFNDFPTDAQSIFISESGKFTKRKFSISGGSVGLFEGKRIGRAKNLEKLEKDIKELSKKVSQTRSNLDGKLTDLLKLKEVSYKLPIEGLQAEIAEINQEYVSIRTKKEQLAEMLSTNANKREDILERIEELENSLNEITPRLDDERAKFEYLEIELETLNEQLQIESELLSQKSTAFNQDNILFHQQNNKVTSLEQEISFKKSAFESSKERIEKSQLEQSSIEQEVRTLLDNNEIKDDELIELYAEKESIEKGVNEAEKDYYASRGEIDTNDKQIRELQKSKEGIDTIIQEYTNALNEVKLKLNSMKERLSVEFEIDLDQLMEENPSIDEDYLTMDDTQIRQIVQKNKEKLEKIGPINPMAMEAYEEIKTRHTFITSQREDLIKAKNSLIETIKEIDEVAKETFLDAFEKIKENFVKVFRSLFTKEDDCDLRLVDPENPLDSPIEIMAKPKGKRPLTINQLSGGEKTLTATSLLFSIYLLKPAPFCIFDEVDAPLDDANIDKFNNIIQTFSKESQFIIVTHNKRTMASTDIIYGITMIEAGVSRVVPVDLRELV